MSPIYQQGPASVLQPSQANDAGQSTPTVNQTDSAWMRGTDRPRIALGTAAGLTLIASMATALYVRRRADARANRVAWLALQAGRVGRIPGVRQTAPFGGAGIALLLSTLLLSRAHLGQAHHPLEELTERFERLHAQADSQLLGRDRLHPRDVLLGAAAAFGLAAVIARSGQRQSASGAQAN